MSPHNILQPDVLPFVLGALAILVFGPVALVQVVLKHRERMAMIRQGIHPDHDQASQPSADKPAKKEAQKEPAWSDWKPE